MNSHSNRQMQISNDHQGKVGDLGNDITTEVLVNFVSGAAKRDVGGGVVADK